MRWLTARRFHPRRYSFDGEAGYQRPQAFNGRLLLSAVFARGPVRLCNGETIDPKTSDTA
jgi:hypothetical protein